ncbi:histidinol-phosphate transaminase [Craterilacuibacter sp. RT1T]|uniref:histidinol-phosphate transaminase n=1 Tax=Craterilacuibacter sp. RT1T TaxID=2942211 RepID=UPI0020C09134|nr:histidinol-phosphate transaminase [Craterilacuibacter sp. RT1T]MCL6263066.1 histidinol-phosphate transaminase [Craterilacuibacter sp. RT1T]
MNLAERAPDYIRAIAPYQAGKPISELAREMGLDEAAIVKLASNENPLGLPPKARAALEAALSDLARYPDGNGFALKAAIAERFALAQDQVLLGNGSNDILELVARTFLRPGDSVVFSEYAFAVYPLVTQATGARAIEVKARDYGHDLDAMLAAIEPSTRLVFIANPNNPTGTLIKPGALLEFLEAVPEQVMVVLDEAYTEYLAPELRADVIGFLARFPNLLVSRTFSKAYGLAGLRVGFALASADIVAMINRVRQPFNVNSLAQAAAVAALDDADFLARAVALNRQGMAQLTAALARLDLPYIPSFANFVTFHVGDAAALNHYFLRHGVIVRPLASYNMKNSLRVSIGLEAENARFIEVLEAALR